VVIPELTDEAGGTGDRVTTTAADTAATPTPAGLGTRTDGLVVLAHQGGWETFPLETLPAFEGAAKSGATVETDVHWTSDGVAVVVHDKTTNSGTKGDRDHPMLCEGGPYPVAKTSWAVLRDRCRTQASASKDGRRYPIPTFDETMKAVAAVPGAQIVPEMKPEQPTATQISTYLETITKYDMAERTIVSSFYPAALAAIQTQAKADGITLRYLLMLSSSPDVALPTPEQLSGQGLWGVALRSDIATHGNVAGLRAKKLTVVVWTVNTTQQWDAARLAGADLVLTDKPTAYRAWAR
jgi:glycerophosphoryl diester phosphodiesterase